MANMQHDDYNEGLDAHFQGEGNPDVSQFKDVPFNLDVMDHDKAAMYGKPEAKSSYALGNIPD